MPANLLQGFPTTSYSNDSVLAERSLPNLV